MTKRGKLIWVVNLTGSAFQRTNVQQAQTGIVNVLHTVQQHSMPATWMLPDPVRMKPVTQNILSRERQEVGLLAQGWASSERNQFSRELASVVELLSTTIISRDH